jgi:DNA-binding MarR family transcriptional regulator
VKSNVTQLVDRLEADGLVARTLDQSDRRSRLAVITPAGRTAHEQGTRVLADAERQVFERLSDDDSLKLAEIISKLARQPQ